MEHEPPRAPFWRSRFGLGWIVLAGVAGWFLWEEHQAHLLGALPYLLLMACPLMHVFMHRGHHHPRDGHHPPPGEGRDAGRDGRLP